MKDTAQMEKDENSNKKKQKTVSQLITMWNYSKNQKISR